MPRFSAEVGLLFGIRTISADRQRNVSKKGKWWSRHKKVVLASFYIPAVLYITGIQRNFSVPSPYARMTLHPSAEYKSSKTTTIGLGFLIYFLPFMKSAVKLFLHPCRAAWACLS